MNHHMSFKPGNDARQGLVLCSWHDDTLFFVKKIKEKSAPRRLVPYSPDFKRTEDAKRLAVRPDELQSSDQAPYRAHGKQVGAVS